MLLLCINAREELLCVGFESSITIQGDRGYLQTE